MAKGKEPILPTEMPSYPDISIPRDLRRVVPYIRFWAVHPVTTNSMNRNRYSGRGAGYMYNSERYMKFKDRHIPVIMEQVYSKGESCDEVGEYVVLIMIHATGDADNYIKPIKDTMQGIVYENDKQVVMSIQVNTRQKNPYKGRVVEVYVYKVEQ